MGWRNYPRAETVPDSAMVSRPYRPPRLWSVKTQGVALG